MRVIRCEMPGPPDVLQFVMVPDPQPGPGEVVVEIEAAAITFVETQVRAGRSPWQEDVDFPMVPGNGVSGTVTAVGEGVGAAWVGRPVVTTTGGNGGYAEQVAVPVRDLHPIPDGLHLNDAAALLADGRTALALAAAADFRSADRVLITAAGGGVGSLLVQIACNAGVSSVIGLAGSARKLALAQELGAGAAVNYRDVDWPEQVRASTDGHGVDVAFDGVGGDVGRAIVNLLADGGRYVPHGMASGTFAPVDEGLVRKRALKVIPLHTMMPGPEAAYDLVERALAEGAAGRLKPTIGQTFPLGQAAEAHKAIEARETLGKTLLMP